MKRKQKLVERVTKPKLPKGWTEAQIRALAKHHDEMTSDELVAEIERGVAVHENQTVMVVPTELVPEINKLIAKKRPA
jgi:hypothetical protein